MIAFRVKTNLTEGIAEALANKKDRISAAVAQKARANTEPYVPALTESLNNRTRVVGDTIIYPGPYARFLYYGKVMIDPNTGSTYAPEYGSKVVTDRNLVFTKEVHPQAQAFWFEASKAQNLDKWLRVAQEEARRGR